MSFSAETAVANMMAEATRCGAKPFKDATGNWAGAVEVALLDTVLSVGAHVDGAYGAGVLPRLRAFKAFRGPANMMRVLATLGPVGLADFVPEKQQMDTLMKVAGSLLDTGVQTAGNVRASNTEQRKTLTDAGLPELSWDYFLLSLGIETLENVELKERWLSDFVNRVTGTPVLQPALRNSLLASAAERINEENQRRAFGRLPVFTLDLLIQTIIRSEYARATSKR